MADYDREDINSITLVELIPPVTDEDSPCLLITDAAMPINVVMESSDEAEIVLDAG